MCYGAALIKNIENGRYISQKTENIWEEKVSFVLFLLCLINPCKANLMKYMHINVCLELIK